MIPESIPSLQALATAVGVLEEVAVGKYNLVLVN